MKQNLQKPLFAKHPSSTVCSISISTQKFDCHLCSLLQPLATAISIDNGKYMVGIEAHLRALMVAGWSAYATYGIANDRHILDV